jgi:hypothetical protein
MRNAPRPRRELRPVILVALRPFLRYSTVRDAYVLRVIGNRWGPVLRRRGAS